MSDPYPPGMGLLPAEQAEKDAREQDDEGWPVKADGTPYPAKKDGTPDMRGGNGKNFTPEMRRRAGQAAFAAGVGVYGRTPEQHSEHSRRGGQAAAEWVRANPEQAREYGRRGAEWVRANPEQARENGRRGGQAAFAAGVGVYGRTPEQHIEHSRRGGQARAEAHQGGSWGCSGYIGDVWCNSACEKRVYCYLLTAPGEVRRYSTEQDGRLEYLVPGEDVPRRWIPDLTHLLPDGTKHIYEVKHCPGHPLVLSEVDVAAVSGVTANNIVAKCAAHPEVRVVNGVADWLVEWYATMRTAGQLPPFTPDVKGAPDR